MNNVETFDCNFNLSIVDITKPPYNADNTGKKDCTAILNKILDDILQANIDGISAAKKKLEEYPKPDYNLSFEIRKEKEALYVIFPEDLEPTKIIYFPNGTYLVSDTITYSHRNLMNIFADEYKYELNRQIHFRGENRDSVIIKLKDNCPGFSYGSQKPVINFMNGDESNVAMSNTIENMTIDTGNGNSGAVGMVFFANNSGTIRNIRIVSEDLSGYAGIEIKSEFVSGCYANGIEITGFDYGIRLLPLRNYVTFENVFLENQRKYGIYVKDTIVSILNYQSHNKCPALRSAGQAAHIVLLNGVFWGGNPRLSGIEHDLGTIFLRNIHSEGYLRTLYSKPTLFFEDVNDIDEYSSDGVWSAFEQRQYKSLSLPIKSAPDEEAYSRTVYSDAYGTAADGVQNDTSAIQAAVNSGADCIVFQPGTYLINDSIFIPETVRKIDFSYCNFISGKDIEQRENAGIFVVAGEGERPLFLENVFAWEKMYGRFRFIHHASRRTLVLRNIHTQTCAMYFNSVSGGIVFVENCACTVGDEMYRDIPCFCFSGQKVWMRNVNPERASVEILNDHSTVWILGFKTEGTGTSFKTINGGKTEVLGGIISLGHNEMRPAVINDNSDVTVIASTNGLAMSHTYPVAVMEVQGNEKRVLAEEVFPLRIMKNYKIPLYVSRTVLQDGL